MVGVSIFMAAIARLCLQAVALLDCITIVDRAAGSVD